MQINSSISSNSVQRKYSFKVKNSSISNYSVQHTKTVPFQTIKFSISTQFKCQNSSISSSSVWHKYAVKFYLTHRQDPTTDCVSYSTNALGKGMNPIFLPPAMSKQEGRLGSSALMRQLVQEKENSEFKPVKLRLKSLTLCHILHERRGLVNMDRTLPQNGPWSDGNEGVLRIPKSSSITGTSPSDCLVSYPGYSLVGDILPLCREAVDVFYSPSRLGHFGCFC